jgi:hypothetical protein
MTVPNSANTNINDLIDDDYSWKDTANTNITLTYNASLSAWAYDSLDNITSRAATDGAFTNTTLLKDAMKQWSNVAGVTFTAAA